MIYRHLLFTCLLTLVAGAIMAQTQIQGKVTDGSTGETVPFVNVALYKQGALITGAQTDFDGNYVIGNIDGGTYDVEVSIVGYQTQRQTGVAVGTGKVTTVDFALGVGEELQEVVIIEYKKPLVEQDNTTSGGTLTGDDIAKLGIKEVNALAATTAGLASTDGSTPTVRGSRSSGTDYYLDGIRISGSLIPQSEIEELTALVGGIPASFGDVSGGVISAVSKGPSQRTSGGIELETSEFLDDYGYNLATGYLSGPILKNSEGRTVFGYRVSGQYRNIDDQFPSAVGVHRATRETINDLTLNPLNEDQFLNAQFETLESNGGGIQRLDARPNSATEDLNLTAKLDWRLAGGALDVSFSGNYIDESSFFTPATGAFTTGATDQWATFNWINNPEAIDNTLRGTLRIRHRLGKNNVLTQPEEGEEYIAPLIQNASYTIIGGYQKRTSDREDIRHQDRVFEYGYVGSFDQVWEPGLSFNNEISTFEHSTWNRLLTGYTPNSQGINPGWVALNRDQEGEALNSVQDYRAFNGGRNTQFTSVWNYLDAPGDVYNTFQELERDRYTLDVRTNFDIVPRGVDKGRHSIEIGFLYEQRLQRLYSMNPERLYDEARLRSNELLSGVDTTVVIDRMVAPNGDTVDIYQPLLTGGEVTNSFFRNIRDDLGIDYTDYVNIESITPEDFRLDWFTPQELTNNLGSSTLNILDMYGYDYLGNKLDSDVSFDDFFTDADGDGEQDFLVGAWQPNYLAAFVQDKFVFRDIIFRLGLRVERYDANTKVLRDPYSLYEIADASEYVARTGNPVPESVQDNYKVYVTGDQNTTIQAFRDGDQWYNALGEAVNQGRDIFGQGGTVNPYYVIPDRDDRDIRSVNFINNIDGSFEDYDPEINFAPRLSFSFPISEASNFFANYDVLYQRPINGTVQTALDYYYFEQRANPNFINNNPALQPVQTTQYEVGFNQKISNSSALRIQAFYKEERDRVQARTLLQVATPIGSYTTYDNIDFATIKGFSFTYDMRRTGNVTLLANYTLQFADGTGSDATSQRTLSTSGEVIRTLSPLEFDERHRFNVNLDYRYGSGKKYNGPKLFGKDIFANVGANLQMTAVSGRPYTRSTFPAAFSGSGFEGGLNEARYPWTYNIDARIDKDFAIARGGDGKRPLSLNVYFRVQNLLDTRNEVGAYTFTGDPHDSGFLSHPRGVEQLQIVQDFVNSNAGSEQSFLDIYSVSALEPGFFTLPRRMYLGVIFGF